MGPKDKHTPSGGFFQQPLGELINRRNGEAVLYKS